jgi:uncharacterized protein YyaL (SSP411 family)
LSNRLIHEQSLYLLQHAENPVDWFPWGEEALKIAKISDKPIFLSVGYAACHWCHVMESECFTDPEVAGLLNRFFIPVKVDREERPDIDRIYMSACQLMTGSGGWPLSIFLTPDLLPFFAATYIPRRSTEGRPGMLELLPYLADIWKNRRPDVFQAGDAVLDALNGTIPDVPGQDMETGIPDEIIHTAFNTLVSLFDPDHGGFGRAPKFPSVPQLLFLLRYWSIFREERALKMVVDTLLAMARGGIRDQIGYGFHRYATDQAWNIPHFEKMLSDQAMNAIVFSRAWLVTKDGEMKEAATDCLFYMKYTLQQPEGGFACAEDADSAGGEGAFYLWRTEELSALLTPDELRFAKKFWDIRDEGNTRPGSGIARGENIPRSSLSIPPRPGNQGEEKDSKATMRKIREKLYCHRETRQRPRLDDKILADWNGLAIEALATGAMIFGGKWMAESAEKAAAFLLSSLVNPDGTLLHRWRKGQAGIGGTAQDYIFVASGLVTLFQATGLISYLQSAVRLTDTAIRVFRDHERGGFFATRGEDPALPVRLRDDYDGPVPSVSGYAYQLLCRLACIIGREDYQDLADGIVKSMAGTCRERPVATLSLLGPVLGKKTEIRAVITGEPGDAGRERLWRILTGKDIAGLVIIPLIPSSGETAGDLIPDAGQAVHGPVPAVWLCSDRICRPPVMDPRDLSHILDEITRS